MSYPVSRAIKWLIHNFTDEHGEMEIIRMNGDEKSGVMRCRDCGQKIEWRGEGKNMEFRNVL
jgi:hypothetical protein